MEPATPIGPLTPDGKGFRFGPDDFQDTLSMTPDIGCMGTLAFCADLRRIANKFIAQYPGEKTEEIKAEILKALGAQARGELTAPDKLGLKEARLSFTEQELLSSMAKAAKGLKEKTIASEHWRQLVASWEVTLAVPKQVRASLGLHRHLPQRHRSRKSPRTPCQARDRRQGLISTPPCPTRLIQTLSRPISESVYAVSSSHFSSVSFLQR